MNELEDKTKKVPENGEYQSDDSACSAEFGSEGCKIQEDDIQDKK